MTGESTVELGTLYDFNKSAMKNEKPLDPIVLSRKVSEIAQWAFNDDNNFKYIMLLCNDNKDYTVFNLKAKEIKKEEKIKPFLNDLKCCFKNRGMIKAIDLQPDGAYEIWIEDFHSGENFAYYLFNYNYGVLEF